MFPKVSDGMDELRIFLIFLLTGSEIRFSYSCTGTGYRNNNNNYYYNYNPNPYDYYFVTCSATHLQFDYPTATKKLTLEGSLSSIPSSYFTKFSSTNELSLSSLNVKEILPGGFNNLQNLRILHLDHNSISSIENGIFNHLFTLEELYLEFNKIENITEHALSGLDSLSILNLNDNRIHTLPSSLNSLNRLRSFNVSNNLLTIDNWPNSYTTNLDLSSNNIISIQGGFSTVELRLHHNNINQINSSMFKNSYKLTYLDLSFNNITFLETNTFNKKNVIETLLLNNNKLSKLYYGCIRVLTELRLLDWANNLLQMIPLGEFDTLTKLEKLNLAGNFLQNMFEFTYLSVQSLNLKDNQLTDLTIDLKYMPKLTEIFISGNRWECQHLMTSIRLFKDKHIKFDSGENYSVSNIFGIPCENDSLKNIVKNNSTFHETEIYDFFNNKFNSTNFFKYFSSYKSEGDDERQNVTPENEIVKELKINNKFILQLFKNISTKESSLEKYTNELKSNNIIMSQMLKNLTNKDYFSEKAAPLKLNSNDSPKGAVSILNVVLLRLDIKVEQKVIRRGLTELWLDTEMPIIIDIY
ncbi:leucine-rich repeat protein SHOC-2-like [Aethina tumida]|uniref:leucine-rich repeat protein SHOC-2-like n=1 Tax=Aethina tumida TaxID=116153 RepID=UPI002147DDC6|nr:leucine-rich repeat protein SHOC-2-like [Aethina tumida]